MIIFAYVFNIFPLGGGYTIGQKISFSWSFILDLIYHAFLPALSIILFNIGLWFINTRSVASNIVSEDYVTYAEASGLSEKKIIFEYVITNAILPQVTGLALEMGNIFSGALITEMVFCYPGLGTVLYNSIIASDYNLIMGITIFSVFAVSTAILILDLLYPLLDPRVRY
jgi:peptide/nickel transport system permease protein